jgi:hypothetical protein
LTAKDASYKLLETDLISTFNILEYLKSNQGTSFKHYWFQKLEYILWKHWENKSDLKFKAYRITSKNSIEHIYPQHPKVSPKISDELLHNFGNLVLLSVSQNSEYSNKEVNVKQKEFENKQLTYDTLKSFFVFASESWNEKEIICHMDEMISKFIDHYGFRSNI